MTKKQKAFGVFLQEARQNKITSAVIAAHRNPLNYDPVEAIREAYGLTTGNDWRKGSTSHETVATFADGKTYELAKFRHADDAHFMDTAHKLVPYLIAEIQKLREQITRRATLDVVNADPAVETYPNWLAIKSSIDESWAEGPKVSKEITQKELASVSVTPLGQFVAKQIDLRQEAKGQILSGANQKEHGLLYKVEHGNAIEKFKIVDGDCETNGYLPMLVQTIESGEHPTLSELHGRFRIEIDGTVKEITEKDTDLINQVVHIRTPTQCALVGGQICKTCFGTKHHNLGN